VASVIPERQRLGPEHGGEIEWGIEMGEKGPTARGLPFEVMAKPVRIDSNEDETCLTLEVRRQRAGKLMVSGKMDEAVAEIVGGASETPLSLGLAEGGLGQDFIDGLCHGFADGRLAAPSSPNKDGAANTESGGQDIQTSNKFLFLGINSDSLFRGRFP
jgi:hypothetical protein